MSFIILFKHVLHTSSAPKAVLFFTINVTFPQGTTRKMKSIKEIVALTFSDGANVV